MKLSIAYADKVDIDVNGMELVEKHSFMGVEERKEFWMQINR